MQIRNKLSWKDLLILTLRKSYGCHRQHNTTSHQKILRSIYRPVQTGLPIKDEKLSILFKYYKE
jgi:hypothetical protein